MDDSVLVCLDHLFPVPAGVPFPYEMWLQSMKLLENLQPSSYKKQPNYHAQLYMHANCNLVIHSTTWPQSFTATQKRVKSAQDWVYWGSIRYCKSNYFKKKLSTALGAFGKASGYRSANNDVVLIKYWVCLPNVTVLVVEQKCLCLLCEWFSVKLSQWLVAFYFDSSACIFLRTGFYLLFSKVFKLLFSNIRFGA